MVKPENILMGFAGLTAGAILGLTYNHRGMNKLQKQITSERENAVVVQQKLGDERDQYFCMFQMLRSPGFKQGYEKAEELCGQLCWSSQYNKARNLSAGEGMTPSDMYRKARDACSTRGR